MALPPLIPTQCPRLLGATLGGLSVGYARVGADGEEKQDEGKGKDRDQEVAKKTAPRRASSAVTVLLLEIVNNLLTHDETVIEATDARRGGGRGRGGVGVGGGGGGGGDEDEDEASLDWSKLTLGDSIGDVLDHFCARLAGSGGGSVSLS